MKNKYVKSDNWKGDKRGTMTHTIIDALELFATDKMRKKYNDGNPLRTIKINRN